MIELDQLLREQMRAKGADAYQKFLCAEISCHWRELVGESTAAQIQPVKLERNILWVQGKSAAFKDQLKFSADEIIEAVNEAIAEKVIKEIQPAKGFQTTNSSPPKKEAPSAAEFKILLEQIKLTDAEVKACEEQVKKFSDDGLRQVALEALLSHARSQKFKLANDWHKCKDCDALCPPEEMFCNACAIKEREVMVEELYRILYDAPQLKPEETQEILLERMPHMRKECFPETVESARSSLIQKIAATVRIGDEASPDVRILVALKSRLPVDKLTPTIISRTLLELQFNLSDQALLRRRHLLKLKRK